MTELFVAGARIDWERVGENSWLRRIPALNGLGEISFRKKRYLSGGGKRLRQIHAVGGNCRCVRFQSGGRDPQLPFMHL